MMDLRMSPKDYATVEYKRGISKGWGSLGKGEREVPQSMEIQVKVLLHPPDTPKSGSQGYTTMVS